MRIALLLGAALLATSAAAQADMLHCETEDPGCSFHHSWCITLGMMPVCEPYGEAGFDTRDAAACLADAERPGCLPACETPAYSDPRCAALGGWVQT